MVRDLLQDWTAGAHSITCVPFPHLENGTVKAPASEPRHGHPHQLAAPSAWHLNVHLTATCVHLFLQPTDSMRDPHAEA